MFAGIVFHYFVAVIDEVVHYISLPSLTILFVLFHEDKQIK